MARAQQMKALLETNFNCRCPRLEDCERFIVSTEYKNERAGAAVRRNA